MGSRTMTCQLGPTRATLVTNSTAVVDYLRNFYLMTDGAAAGAWVVEATVGPADHSKIKKQWGVGYTADAPARRLRLRAPDPEPLAITSRTSVREVLVDFCEQRRYVMLHASAVVDDRRVVVFAGDRRSGKTTLALKSVLFHGMRYLANDHLIAYGQPAAAPPSSRLRLTTLPGPIGLKVGTYLDLADRLPPPFDTEGLDLDAYRAIPRAERYRSNDRVIYTYRDLGQPHPFTVDLRDPAGGPAVLVVLAGYADEHGNASVPDPVASLLPHVRTDWMFNPRLNPRYLPRGERRPDAYRSDARRLVAALAGRATVIRWRHQGDPGPLLEHPDLGG